MSRLFALLLLVIATTSLPRAAAQPKKAHPADHTPKEAQYVMLAQYQEVDGMMQHLDLAKGYVTVRILDEHLVAKKVTVSPFGPSANIAVAKHHWDFVLKLTAKVILRQPSPGK